MKKKNVFAYFKVSSFFCSLFYFIFLFVFCLEICKFKDGKKVLALSFAYVLFFIKLFHITEYDTEIITLKRVPHLQRLSFVLTKTC